MKPIRPYEPGQKRLSAARLNDQQRELAALAGMQVTGAEFGREGGVYTLNVPGSEKGFLIRIDSEGAGDDSGKYAWTEMRLKSDGTAEVVEGGRTGTVSPLRDYAVELNESQGLVAGKLGWMLPVAAAAPSGVDGEVDHHWRFLTTADAVAGNAAVALAVLPGPLNTLANYAAYSGNSCQPVAIGSGNFTYKLATNADGGIAANVIGNTTVFVFTYDSVNWIMPSGPAGNRTAGFVSAESGEQVLGDGHKSFNRGITINKRKGEGDEGFSGAGNLSLIHVQGRGVGISGDQYTVFRIDTSDTGHTSPPETVYFWEESYNNGSFGGGFGGRGGFNSGAPLVCRDGVYAFDGNVALGAASLPDDTFRQPEANHTLAKLAPFTRGAGCSSPPLPEMWLALLAADSRTPTMNVQLGAARFAANYPSPDFANQTATFFWQVVAGTPRSYPSKFWNPGGFATSSVVGGNTTINLIDVNGQLRSGMMDGGIVGTLTTANLTGNYTAGSVLGLTSNGAFGLKLAYVAASTFATSITSSSTWSGITLVSDPDPITSTGSITLSIDDAPAARAALGLSDADINALIEAYLTANGYLTEAAGDSRYVLA